ncbi:hypothetical protein SPI_09297 [Niveomyces insectorum RCEF 264]|uniref:HNH nuclease domain-containing protein n=1 Tax=Niveomyces insectorum RCEF 264 TaxID=1081102 RepID=A0A162MB22_9HYPO|nr:hypothetical protein SPI_09297 [Niveomyces insectorum RCEF 264]
MDRFRLDIQQARHRHHRHQVSLENVINLRATKQLSAPERAQARTKFASITSHFETANPGLSSAPYDKLKLFRLTYEYSRSEESRDIFLLAFMQSAKLAIDDQPLDLTDRDVEASICSTISEFADFLIESFFLPLRASSKQTPRPSPTIHSAIQRAQGGGVQDVAGTPGRLSTLRTDCLNRDRFRCVVSNTFDYSEAARRFNVDGDKARDDDGNLLEDERGFANIQAAHIIPHSLTETEDDGGLHPFKKATLDILNMFDYGVLGLIEGDSIDKPRNALCLTSEIHHSFGEFKVFFRPVSDAASHTYYIDTFMPRPMLPFLPTTRTLALTETRTIDPPSPRLLAIHCAICQILHLSAAGKYIEEILDDFDKSAVASDGTTELGNLVTLGMAGWLNKSVRA